LAASATVKKFHYVSPEEAAARFKDKFPELSRVVDSLGFNPFPPSIEVTFSKKSLSSSQVEELLFTIQRISGVEEV